MLGRGPRRPGAVAVVAALVLASCAGADESVEVDAPPSSTAGAEGSSSTPVSEPDAAGDGPLDGVTLAVDRAEQLGRVGLEGLDTTVVDVTGLLATYEFADGDWWGTRVLVDADGPYLLAPLYPADPERGGALELYLSDGIETGPPLSLTVTAMPDAPGAFTDALGAMRTEVDTWATDLGSSWDELAAMAPGDVPPELAPLKIVQLVVDDGAAAAAAGGDDALAPGDAALLDAVFGQLELAAGLDPDEFAEMAPHLPEQIMTTDEATDSSETAPQGFAGVHGFAPAPRQGAACIPFFQEGGQVSAGKLSQMMIGSAMSDVALNTNGTPGKTFAAFELAVSLGGALEAGASGGKSNVFGTVGSAATGWKFLNGLRAGVWPSAFSDIDVTPSPGDLEEDRPVTAPGTWPKVQVTAMSTGYSLDGDIAGFAAGKFGGELMKTRLPKGAVDDADDAVSWVDELGDAADLADVNSAAGPDPIKNAVNELLPKDGVITFCPQSFTADIAGAEWSWARRRGSLLTIDNDAQTYVNTTDVGPDTLVVGPIPAKFGQKSIYDDVPVVTKPIDVRIGPDTVFVPRPGDVASITATIRDAYETKLGWATAEGRWQAGGQYQETPDGDTLALITPEDARKFPFRVDVESLSRLNLREDGTPPRYDFVMVDLSPFTIEPDPGTVAVGRQLTFTAKDVDGIPIDVEWRATGGTMPPGPSSTGVYTAGNRAGSYTVTAWLPGQPDEQVTVTVIISDVDCIIGNWELDVPAFVEAMNRFAEGGSVSYISGDSQAIIREDGTATWVMNDVRLRMSQDGQTFTVVWNSTVDNTYSTDGGLYQGGGGTATVNLFVEEFGQGIDSTVPSAIGGNASYDCEPLERLVVHTEDGDLFFTYNGPA